MSVQRKLFTLAAAVAASVTLLASVACAPEPAAGPKPTAPSTSPSTPPPLSPEELRHQAATDAVAALTPRELAASVIMSSVPGTDPSALHVFMQSTGLGGFILMGNNVPGSPEALPALTQALAVDSALPPLVAIDEEGGLVTRLPWDTFPGADTLRTEPVDATSAAFAGRAKLLADAGVTVNFGDIADVTADPQSFIYARTLGDTPQAASDRVAAAVTAERGLVASTLKHFPGHGAAPGDSHFTVPETSLSLDAWRTSDAPPFAAGIAAGAELMMVGHLKYTAVSQSPASLAPEWYAIARDDLGFTGVLITDDLAMLQATGIAEYADAASNVVAALQAGADMALIIDGMSADSLNSIVDRVAAATADGTLPESRLRDAAVRDIELRMQLAEQHSPQTPSAAAPSPATEAP